MDLVELILDQLAEASGLPLPLVQRVSEKKINPHLDNIHNCDEMGPLGLDFSHDLGPIHYHGPGMIDKISPYVCK